MRDIFMSALKKKYEADVDVAKATIEVYLTKSVGIGEHPQFVEEIDKQLEIIGCALDKLRVIDKYYPNEDDIPF
jgi:hypothetical protein|tara:strand:+ start:346 stop:567 length:222 start_codon:yes stop_codon:yes gene_type:complete